MKTTHSSNNDHSNIRSISRIINSIQTTEGEGFIVHRSFPTQTLSEFDPFLLLDEIGPLDLSSGEAKGAPDHPHRGFETVTYMLDGRFEHKDSQGHLGKLGSGDVQWMTAGAGVVHSEMPEKEFARKGGRLHGFQLWVNLPKRDKMMKPHYQEMSSSNIPLVNTADGLVTAKVIAGKALGVNAVIETRIPIMYVHFTFQPGASIVQPVPKEYNTFAYVIGGQGIFGTTNDKQEEEVSRGQMVIFEKDGEQIVIRAPKYAKSPLDILLIGGTPLNEPVARYGPFVMNTKEEVYQAIEDYRNGTMGTIRA
ncbi:MAG TPA: pirin family protein [Nitrososphaeraceae archaeon]|nr:pirin family protein [Nitrososphaeraceae archaeon]